MPETRKQSLPALHTRAAFAPATFDAEARTVELTWSTGATVRRFDWFDGPYLEELSLDPAHVRLSRLESGAPVLANHDLSSLDAVIGVVERAWLNGNEGRARVRFSEREEVAPIIADVRSGILRNISVGYQVHEYDVTPGAKRGDMPTYRAIDWEPFEISLVTVPADASAQIRSAETLHPVIINQRSPAMSEPNTNPASDHQPEPKPVDTAAIAQRAMAEERARVLAITDMQKKYSVSDAIAQRCINDGLSIEQSRNEMVDEVIKRQEIIKPPHIWGGEQAEDKFIAGASRALQARVGIAEDERGNEFRGLSLWELGARNLEMRGVSTRGMTRSEIAGQLLRAHSTSDFPLLLADVANKSLQAAYNVFPTIWRQIAAVGSVSDFKTINMVKLGSFSSLATIVEGAEYTQGSFSESREQLTAVTKGRFIQCTRQMIINDDLGGFNRMAQMLGQAAARTVNADVLGILTANAAMADGFNLFSTDHTNYTGSGTAISVASLAVGRKTMRIQKDVSGIDYLNIQPRYLLTPVGKEDHARTVVQSAYDTDATGKLGRNPIQDWSPLSVLSDPLLDANSTTAWYLMADPMVGGPLLEVRFLDGAQTPYVASEEEFLTDAIRWKVRLDYGVAANEWRSGYKNAGA